MALATLWFVLIAVLWAGFFVLEGFDLGVGMLSRYVGRDAVGREAVVATITPVWDGNEVWLITAGAAMFAAFPSWYATMFSALYLALVVLIAALIARGASFEFHERVRTARWKRVWEWLLPIGSLLIPLLLGVGLGDLLWGLPINSSQDFTGSFWDLLTPYGLFVGVTFTVLCLFHGALFISLKSIGLIKARAEVVARWFAPFAGVLTIAYCLWTHILAGRGVIPSFLQLIAIIAVLAAVWAAMEGLYGWAFVATCATLGTGVLALFADLYPRLMVSSTSTQYNLTVQNSASGSYALKVMTVVVVLLLPVVLVYQAWSYHVFRARIDIPGESETTSTESATTSTE